MDDEIQVISFDMDGTLIPKKFADDFWLERIPKIYCKKTDLNEEKAKERLMEEYDEMGRGDIRWYEPDYWFSRYDIDKNPREVLIDLRKEYELYDDAKEVVKKLHKEYELIVTSNGITMFIKVGLDNYEKYFTSLYSSVTDFRSSSKTPSIYRKVCKDLQVQPEEILHVGDDRENDYIPAKKAGMKAYLLDREGGKRSECTLKDLRELLEIL